MIPFDKCPVCGGNVNSKMVEKLLRGGENTAVLNVKAEVCQHCGERMYSKETIELFENVRHKLEHQDVSEFKPLGRTYQVAS